MISVYPSDGMDRVPADATIQWVFDQPTAKSAIYSIVDLAPGGGIPTTLPTQWSALGDTMLVKPLAPLEYGHLYGIKLNNVQDTSGTWWDDRYYPTTYFTVIAPAKIERVSPANVGIAITPDVPMPVNIPVRETANTDAWFRSVRVQFLLSPQIAYFNSSSEPDTLDKYVQSIYETTQPLSSFLPRHGVANLQAVANLPDAVARNIPQGQLGMRLTFYGDDEVGFPIALDLVYRLDPTTVETHSASVVPAMASDLLIQSVVLESPVHGMVVAAGDTILPRATVIGNGTGGFRGAFYLDGALVAIEEGFMEAGRPVTIEMRGPLPTRRFGEHQLQFQVESPQLVAANPVSFTCAPVANGLAPDPWTKAKAQDEALPPSKLSGAVRWTAQGNSKFGDQEGSAVGWAGWRGGYTLSQTRRLETDFTFRLRFDDTGNGSGKPQYLSLRYVGPSGTLEVSDAAPAKAAETPLLMSATPRRSAQAKLTKTPLGEVSAYMALASHLISSGGSGVNATESDLYAARISREFSGGRGRASLYGGYTHEDETPSGTLRRSIYGGMGTYRLAEACSLLADAATVYHRAVEGISSGRSRTAWRAQFTGRKAGIQGTAQAFSYQPELATALNPYALSNRRGGMGEIAGSLWKWRFFGNFRSEQPQERAGLEPIVVVNRSSVGGSLELNPQSWVTPSIVRVTHRGANIEYVETRLATELSTAERRGGHTSARFDIATMEDERRPNTRRRISSGSIVTTGSSSDHLCSTLAAGVEWDRNRDLDLANTTLQGSFELRWEAVPGKLLIAPFVDASQHDYSQQGTRESRYAARLQIAFLRVPGLRENAVSLEGRVDRLKRFEPLESTTTDGSVMLFVGQRFGVGNPK